MRIPCPHCGERDHAEFTYRGDATVSRPSPDEAGLEHRFYEYVYIRPNPAGWHREYWYHEGGCRQWIIVERNTTTHSVRGAVDARSHSETDETSEPGDSGK